MTLATTLATAGFGISIINPVQAHYFAKALLKRSKTDAIDAHTLARLAALLQPAPWTPPPAIYYELHQRLSERDQFVSIRQQVRNHLHALLYQPIVIKVVRARLADTITMLNRQITAIERELAQVLQQDDAWAQAAARLQTIPGVGQLSAAWMLVATLNFSVCPTPEAAAAYAGLVPHTYQSGTSVWKPARIAHTGHGRLRTVLYMITLSAAQHNPRIKPFHDRLRTAGKPHKVARCAAARKLLHIAWAVATKGKPFAPHYHERHVAQQGAERLG